MAAPLAAAWVVPSAFSKVVRKAGSGAVLMVATMVGCWAGLMVVLWAALRAGPLAGLTAETWAETTAVPKAGS